MAKMTVTIKGGGRAESEQDEDGDEVDEGRHRLHQVEDRLRDAPDMRLVRGPDAKRHADGHGQRGGRDYEHQRLDGLLPQPLVDDEEQAEQNAERQRLRALQPVGESRRGSPRAE